MSVKAAGYELSMQVISVHTNEQSEEEKKSNLNKFLLHLFIVCGGDKTCQSMKIEGQLVCGGGWIQLRLLSLVIRAFTHRAISLAQANAYTCTIQKNKILRNEFNHRCERLLKVTKHS